MPETQDKPPKVELYPTPSKGVLANTPDVTPPLGVRAGNTAKKTFISKSGLRIIASQHLALLLGLVSILVPIFILGIYFSSGFFSHSNRYMGNFDDLFSLIFVAPILLVLFVVISIIRGDKIFIAFPFIVFFLIGPIVENTILVQGVERLIPFTIDTLRSTNKDLATALVAYTIIVLIEGAFSRLLLRGRFKHGYEPEDNNIIRLSGMVIAIFGIVTLAIGFIAASWYVDSSKTNEKSVIMPNTADLYGAIDEYASQNSYHLYYLPATEQIDGTYNMFDRVSFSHILKPEDRNLESACNIEYKNDTRINDQPQQIKTTSRGMKYKHFPYAQLESNPKAKSRTFKGTRICFIIDDKRYTIERTDKYGTEYLEKFPDSFIVDAFKQNKNQKQLTCRTVSQICSNEDIKKSPRESLPPQIKSRPFTGTEILNQYAFANTGEVRINELGISFPTSEHTSNLMYEPSTTLKDTFLVAFKNENTTDCKLPSQNPSGYGIARVQRVLKSTNDLEIKENQNQPQNRKVIGDYVYKIHLSATAKNCLEPAKLNQVIDSFEWATTNIKKTTP